MRKIISIIIVATVTLIAVVGDDGRGVMGFLDKYGLYDMSGDDFITGIMSIVMVIGVIMAIVILIWLILMIPYSIIISAYSMTVYIMNENPGMGAMDCIRESRRIMYGHKWEYFVLKLSFLPWFLLSYITLGLALIYVVPYMKLTITDYYHNIKGTSYIESPLEDVWQDTPDAGAVGILSD